MNCKPHYSEMHIHDSIFNHIAPISNHIAPVRKKFKTTQNSRYITVFKQLFHLINHVTIILHEILVIKCSEDKKPNQYYHYTRYNAFVPSFD